MTVAATPRMAVPATMGTATGTLWKLPHGPGPHRRAGRDLTRPGAIVNSLQVRCGGSSPGKRTLLGDARRPVHDEELPAAVRRLR